MNNAIKSRVHGQNRVHHCTKEWNAYIPIKCLILFECREAQESEARPTDAIQVTPFL